MFQRSLEPDLEQGLGKEIIASERPNVQGFIVNTKSVEHRQPCQLLDLPFDNVLLIIEHLNFDDILRLRAVCPQLQAFFNPKLLSYVMGQALFAQERDRYCGICFRKAPDDNFTNCRTPTFLLKPNEASDEWWCICVDCGFKKNDPRLQMRGHMFIPLVGLPDNGAWRCCICGDIAFCTQDTQELGDRAWQIHHSCFSRWVHWFRWRSFLRILQFGFTIAAWVLILGSWKDCWKPVLYVRIPWTLTL